MTMAFRKLNLLVKIVIIVAIALVVYTAVAVSLVSSGGSSSHTGHSAGMQGPGVIPR
jgi:hypothetical protein